MQKKYFGKAWENVGCSG